MPSVRTRGDPDLLERAGELELIAGLVARVRGGEGALLVVEGQAGVGKTELLRTAGDLGDAEGLSILRTRGSELDRDFAFGMVRQLLGREVAEAPELLRSGAEPAASVFAASDDAHAEEGIFSTSTELAAPYWERRLAQLQDGEELHPTTLACLVVAIAASRGPAGAALSLGDRVLEAGWLGEPNSVVAGLLGNGLIYAGAPSRAGRFYDETIATATRRGSRLTVAWQSVMRSDASLRLGEIRRAEAEARAGLELFEEGSGVEAFVWATAHLLNALVARGAVEEGDEVLGRGIVGPSAAPTLPLGLFLAARAYLHLAQGRSLAALRDAQEAGDLMSATIHNPGCCAWRSVAALSLAGARPYNGGARSGGGRAGRRAPVRRPRCAGHRAANARTRRRWRQGVEALRASVAALELAEGRLEYARSLLELGAALRRAGERAEARDVLREALDATARAGASGLADRAHEELVAAGARPRRGRRLLSGRESLTASEDRVAALAAEGLTNREIAQRQFVTVKAVQWHLRNVYRKLDVASRQELPAALGGGPLGQNTGAGRLAT